MQTLSDYIARIETFNWVNVVDGKLVDSHGMTLTLRVETSQNGIQALFIVGTPNGKSFSTWGAESLSDSNDMAIFFSLKKQEIREKIWERERVEDKMFQAIFNGK
jgi:hypothetical protein